MSRPLRRLILSSSLLLMVFFAWWTLNLFGPLTVAARPAPTLIVLGAAQYNGRPSPLFQRRLDHALALYEAGGVRRIIVAGGVGKGDRFSEGDVGVRYLAARGVPGRVLRAEDRSRTTVQNLENSVPLLERRDAPVTLVTDEIHAPRALAIAQDLGYRADVSPAPLRVRTEQGREYQTRERLLLVVQKLFGNSAMR